MKEEAAGWLKVFAVAGGLAVAAISIAASSGAGRAVRDAVPSFPGADTLGHFLLVGVIAFLVSLAFIGNVRELQASRWLKVVLILACLTTLDEFLQLALPRRAFQFSDLAANYAGILVLSLVALSIRRHTGSESPDVVGRHTDSEST